jgi:tRNA pseudouridine55 synthase
VIACGWESTDVAAAFGIELPIRPLCRQLVEVGPVESLPRELPMVVEEETGFHFRRRGEQLVLAPVRVTVERWEVLARRGDELDVRIVCGGGTYVRSLARDLGALSASAAHVVSLRRIRAGMFDVADAVTTEELRGGIAPLRPARDAVPSLPAETLEAADVARVARGQPVTATVAGQRAALLAAGGDLVAIAERHGEAWQPRVVLRTS